MILYKKKKKKQAFVPENNSVKTKKESQQINSTHKMLSFAFLIKDVGKVINHVEAVMSTGGTAKPTLGQTEWV